MWHLHGALHASNHFFLRLRTPNPTSTPTPNQFLLQEHALRGAPTKAERRKRLSTAGAILLAVTFAGLLGIGSGIQTHTVKWTPGESKKQVGA